MRGRGGAQKECPQEWGHGSLERLLYEHAASFGAGPELRRPESLCHRNLHQGVLRAGPGDGTAVAAHAFIVADPQYNRTQPERFLALHDALAAAVALLDRKSTRLNSSHA